jgi:tripartite-type tricarboxylate transporter receptor subunit TctC
MMFDWVPGVIQHIRSGRLRALAVTSPQRPGALPEVPTLRGGGGRRSRGDCLARSVCAAEHGAGSGSPAVERRARCARISRIERQFAGQGAEPGTMSQPEFAKFVGEELVRWNRVITAANIRLD